MIDDNTSICLSRQTKGWPDVYIQIYIRIYNGLAKLGNH
jgi:hypothetical protein